jgi:hypothetical protein
MYQISVEYLHPLKRKVWKTGSGMTNGWTDRPWVNYYSSSAKHTQQKVCETMLTSNTHVLM